MTLKPSTAIFATATLIGLSVVCYFAPGSYAQLPDKTVTPNSANTGINKSFAEQAGAGRGDVMTLNSSMFIIKRDPFRANSPRTSTFSTQVHEVARNWTALWRRHR